MKEDEMWHVWDTQGLVGELKERDHLEEVVGADVRIILKWVIRK
jgi:hypothetical protein